MAVGLAQKLDLLPVKGVQLGAAAAGIRYRGRSDLVIIEAAAGSTCAAVFTRNAFCAAPVMVARQHLASAVPRLLLINAGNANAGTGPAGIKDAKACCAALAELAGGIEPAAVLPFSTGVIGAPLPVAAIRAALPHIWEARSPEGWSAAAQAMMTTDTVPKGISKRFLLQGRPVTLTGIAKGAGMICPDMATMLAFLATDAAVPQEVLQYCLHNAVAVSFNRITIDGDTSTNDACVLLASGQSGATISAAEGPDFTALQQAVSEVCLYLAHAIIRDGEGATKFITVEVVGGAKREESEKIAYTIAHSPLVKTAFFASDPNWGRILAAIGRSGVPGLDLAQVSIYISEVCVIQKGVVPPDYTEARGHAAMERDEITLRVELGQGEAAAQVWTCDFSYDYIKINAEYRS
jgi:glutamate N-acetyltransferase / amino-acid N-acetyltransferase